MSDVLSACAFVFDQPVVWGDMDAFGHLNNVMYYRYVESARIAYLTQVGALGAGNSCVIATSNCHYLHQVLYPDTLKIGVNILNMKTTSFTMKYTLYSATSQQVVAISEAVIVLMDQASYRKKAISDALRAQIDALETAAQARQSTG